MALSINSTTGTIDLSASTAGTYTVRYTTADGFATTQVTVQNCSFTNTRSLDLDGVNDYAQGVSASALQGAASCTVMAWVRFDEYPYLEAIAHNWINPNYLYLLRYYNGQWEFYIRGNGVTRIVVYTMSISQNTWYHVVGVKDGTTLRLYVNGSQVSTNSTSIPVNMQNNTSGFTQDRISGYDSAYLGGQVDELALWTSAVSASNISTIYNSGNGAIDLTPYNPVNWWRMEEGSGQIVTDSGSANTQLNLYNGAGFSTLVP